MYKVIPKEFCAKMDALVDEQASTGPAVLSSFCNYLHSSGKKPAEILAELDTDGGGELDETECQ